MVAGDVTSSKWGGGVLITMREEGKRSARFTSDIARGDVRFSTTAADLRLARSSVTVLPNGDYHVIAFARGDDGPIAVDIVVHPAPRAYFPGASFGVDDFVSGYTVPGLRASASGKICIASKCETYDEAQSYHDHNWGVWKGVTWDWGASRAGAFTILYGRVIAPDAPREAPLFVYLVDSLGFRAVMRPASISYVDGRTAMVDGKEIRVPSRAVFADVRGADTLRVELEIEDAIATDTRKGPQRQNYGLPYFIQMKGIAKVSGRIGGESVSGSGTGFFETYR
jgi:hypothetical protein